MKCGMIGLGKMGSGIAQTLARAGYEMVVYNRTKNRAEALAGKGISVVETPGQAAQAGVVITMLADDHAVEEVLPQILEGLKSGSIHISCSTISPSLSARLEERHAGHGSGYVAAPVFGRPDMAASGNLVVVAAGKPWALERVAPLLEKMGRRLFVIGEKPSLANVVKLAGNFLIAGMLEALGESYALIEKSGLAPQVFLEIVNGNIFQSPIIQNYGTLMAEGRFEPAGFKMRLGLKDVELVIGAAREAEVPLPLASLVRDQLLSGIARGKGESDWSALGEIIAENAGLKPAQPKGSA